MTALYVYLTLVLGIVIGFVLAALLHSSPRDDAS